MEAIASITYLAELILKRSEGSKPSVKLLAEGFS